MLENIQNFNGSPSKVSRNNIAKLNNDDSPFIDRSMSIKYYM